MAKKHSTAAATRLKPSELTGDPQDADAAIMTLLLQTNGICGTVRRILADPVALMKGGSLDEDAIAQARSALSGAQALLEQAMGACGEAS